MESIFGIGIAELIFIAIIALIVLGPERLPGAIRSVTSVIRQIRNLSNELTSQFSEEIKTLEEINPKNLLKELSSDLLGEEDEKNNKGAGTKPGSAKPGSTKAAVTTASTKATTRAAATTKPAAATTTPRRPTTPVKKVAASNGEAEKSPAGADNEKAPADKTQADSMAGNTGKQDTGKQEVIAEADNDVAMSKVEASKTEASATDNQKAPEVVAGVETDTHANPGTDQDDSGSAAEGVSSKPATAASSSTASPVSSPTSSPTSRRTGLPGGIGTRNAGAGFAAGSIPKHIGIPAKSRKVADSADSAPADAGVPEPDTPATNPAARPAAAESKAVVESENSILPPETMRQSDAHAMPTSGKDERGQDGTPVGANQRGQEPEPSDINNGQTDEPIVEKASATPAEGSTVSLRVNGKTADSQGKA